MNDLEKIDEEELEPKEKIKQKKTIYISCIVSLAVLVALLAIVYNMTRGVKVYAEDIAPKSISSKISTVGTVRSGSERAFYAFTQARVTALNVKAGDTVNQGEVMALFSSAEIDADVALKKYQAENAAAVVEKGKNNIRLLNTTVAQLNQEISTLSKQLGVSSVSTAGEKKLQATFLTYSDKALVVNTSIADELNNMENVAPEIKKLLIQLEEETASQIRTALAASESASITSDELKSAIASALSGAESKLEKAMVNSDEKMRKQLQLVLLKQQKNILSTQIPSSEEMNRLQAASDAANQAYQTALTQSAELKAGWIAPFTGVVSEVNITQDGVTSVGTPGIVLVDTSTLVVDVELGKYDAGKVSNGQAVKIRVDDDVLDGTVSFVSSIASAQDENQNPFVPCRIMVSNPDKRLIIGFDVDVDIQTASADSVIILPVTSLRIDELGKYCYRYNKEEHTVSKVYVDTGIINEEYCQITIGLQFGDTIILNPSDKLYDGARVRLMDPEETTAPPVGLTTALYDNTQEGITAPAAETTTDKFSYPNDESLQNTTNPNYNQNMQGTSSINL